MPRTPQHVTDAELSVLFELWQVPDAMIRELANRLYSGGEAWQYATVQKLLERLQDKGYVRRLPSTSPARFAAAVGRDELIGRLLRAMADRLCEGSLAPLLIQLVRSQPMSAAERQGLRQLIDHLDAKARKPGGAKERK
ncbi:MAG: BlaI/MecI/CopY family transcriptional regulator [Tepidisphaeraceae bacterium]|jgi:predicted transcriptional regulator